MSELDDRLGTVQIGINSRDLAGSLRLYADLGFHNAGGHMICGRAMAIQGLPPSARGFMWWLVGRQERLQLELFHHSNPQQRPLPPDWRCCDLGWTRFGIAVPDFDAAKTTLTDWDIAVTGEVSEAGQPKRLAFRDPFVGCFVEILEDGDAIPGGSPPYHHDLNPAVVYATSSVSDLAAARSFYEDMLQQEITDDIVIHRPQHEALWGLSGARSESFVVKGGGFLLEIVQYLDPVGRPKPKDYAVVDQGLLNVAIASHKPAPAKQAIDRARQAGYRVSPMVVYGDACGAYVLEPEREVEIMALPTELEAELGYVPGTPFFDQQPEG